MARIVNVHEQSYCDDFQQISRNSKKYIVVKYMAMGEFTTYTGKLFACIFKIIPGLAETYWCRKASVYWVVLVSMLFPFRWQTLILWLDYAFWWNQRKNVHKIGFHKMWFKVHIFQLMKKWKHKRWFKNIIFGMASFCSDVYIVFIG